MKKFKWSLQDQYQTNIIKTHRLTSVDRYSSYPIANVYQNFNTDTATNNLEAMNYLRSPAPAGDHKATRMIERLIQTKKLPPLKNKTKWSKVLLAVKIDEKNSENNYYETITKNVIMKPYKDLFRQKKLRQQMLDTASIWNLVTNTTGHKVQRRRFRHNTSVG